MYVSFRGRLRFAALRQLVRDVRQRGNTFGDVMRFLGDRLRIARRGHLTPECATYASSDALEFVDDERDLTEEVRTDAFVTGISRSVSRGCEDTGLDPTFLRCVLGHFRSCPECRAMVLEELGSDWNLMKETRAVIAMVREGDPDAFDAQRRALADKLLRHL